MRRWAAFAVAAGLAASCWAQESAPAATGQSGGDLSDPKEILKKADEATKKVKSVRYVGEFLGTGSNERAPQMSGTVILSGETAQGLDKFRFEIRIKDPVSNLTQDIVAVSNGDKYWLIDHNKKTVEEDIDPIVLGQFGQRATLIGMREFVHPQPFNDEITGQKAELRGIEKIGHEECYKIWVKYSQENGGQEATWWFGKKDFLPRGVERYTLPPAGPGGGENAPPPKPTGSVILKITELAADPTFTTDPFSVVVPEGYKKTGGAPEPATPKDPEKDK